MTAFSVEHGGLEKCCSMSVITDPDPKSYVPRS
jgi:hypothetical protein